MADRAQNLQDTFLNYVRKNKTPLTIFLVNGVKLQGIVTWFDNFCVLLRRDGHSQLVYKHAISTIMPGTPLQLFEPQEEGHRPGSGLTDTPELSLTEGKAELPAPSGRALVLVPVVRGGEGRGGRARPGYRRPRRGGGRARASDRPRRRRDDRRAARQLPAGDAVRHRQGRGDRRAGRGRQGRAGRSSTTPFPRCSSAISRRPGRPRSSTAPA